MDTYCVVKTEREKLQSHVVSNSDDPMYNLHGLFFRYDICKPLVVEVKIFGFVIRISRFNVSF